MQIKKLMGIVLLIACLALPVAFAGHTVNAQSSDTIVWAFVPSENTQKVLDSAKQFSDLVSTKTGLKISAVVTTDYAGVVEAMCNGQAQMASLNTFGYIVASARKCADVSLVSVRNGSTTYKGQIITKADSGIKTLADLKGKTFCRPDPLSTSGWIVPSITMKANGIDPTKDLKQIVDMGSHDAVAENVYNGNCDAGATFDDARTDIQNKYPDILDKVVVIAKSAAIPNDTVAFAPAFDATQRATIVKAIQDIAADKANAAMLQAVYNWTGVAAAKDSFFDDFRQQLDAAGVQVNTLLPTPKPTEEATMESTMGATMPAATMAATAAQ